jgi:hypothetical protein
MTLQKAPVGAEGFELSTSSSQSGMKYSDINGVWKIFETFWGKLESISGLVGAFQPQPF